MDSSILLAFSPEIFVITAPPNLPIASALSNQWRFVHRNENSTAPSLSLPRNCQLLSPWKNKLGFFFDYLSFSSSTSPYQELKKFVPLASSSMESNPLYGVDKGFKVMPSSYHDISKVEFQDTWDWFGMLCIT
ncbi:hypothetical protein EV2_037091 [Malus domestica]|uniref:Uncharacterized protein n=1 Tax=Malus domestica TaxID=3750 RepID=A0A498JU82_MALDO|nr:hypothetical protein DVH24_010931 [Malus domestica]